MEEKLIRDNVDYVHFTDWKNIINRNAEIIAPQLSFEGLYGVRTPLVIDEDGMFGPQGYMFKKSQFGRIFVNDKDCEEYLRSAHVDNAIYQDLYSGKSYLNYITLTDEKNINEWSDGSRKLYSLSNT